MTANRVARVAVCIPTADRPHLVARLIASIEQQTLRPSLVLIVDASNDPAPVATAPVGDLRVERIKCERGLPQQREIGIVHIGLDTEYLCMLDDDMVLRPGFLEEAVSFLESPEGEDYGGVSGYDDERWGRPFGRLTRIYHKLKLLDGELAGGRWFYVGAFTDVDKIPHQPTIVETDFLPGGMTVWRTNVLYEFAQPSQYQGYAAGEDKHFSLRVRSRYRIGVLGTAMAVHLHQGGGRPRYARVGIGAMLGRARCLRDCDPRPTARRYLAFIAFHTFDLLIGTFAAFAQLEPKKIAAMLGWWTGLIKVALSPPPRSPEALVNRSRWPAPAGRGAR